MKYRFWQLFLALSVFGSGTAYAEEVPASPAVSQEVTNTTLVPFFVALRNGDVKSLRRYLSPAVYKQYQVLMEQNQDYPHFLRDFYHTAQMKVNSVSEDGNDVIADITISFGNGDENNIRLVARRDTGGVAPEEAVGRPRGPWQVVKEDAQEGKGR